MAPRFDRRSLLRFGLGTAAAAVPTLPALPAQVAPAAPGSAPAFVVTGHAFLHGRPAGDLGGAEERNWTLNLVVRADGSATLRLFDPARPDPDGVAAATVDLPAPVGTELQAALFRAAAGGTDRQDHRGEVRPAA
jgi:hypothetical protein